MESKLKYTVNVIFSFILLLVAVLIPVSPLVSLCFVALLSICVFFLFLKSIKFNTNGILFASLFFPIFIFPILFKLSGVSLFGGWQALILLVSFLGLKSLLQECTYSKLFKFSMVAFLLYIMIGFLSSLFGRSHFIPALYQFISNIKPILLICLGFVFGKQGVFDKYTFIILKYIWIPIVLLIFFEWLSPNLYFSIFSGGPKGISPDLTGVFPSRAVGIFEHPSFLASFASFSVVLLFGRMIFRCEHGFKNITHIFVYFAILIASVQRQELLSCICALLIVYLLLRPEKILSIALIGVPLSITLLALFGYMYWDNIITEATAWGIGSNSAIQQPRAQIFSWVTYIIHHYWPLGSGWGTYAGAGADKFDQSFYNDLGFGRYWWYGKEDYLMDTYWPNPIAETGVFGSLSLMISFVLLFTHSIIRCLNVRKSESRLHYSLCAALMFYTITLSFSSPAFQDPRLFFVPAILFGIAAVKEKESDNGWEKSA